MNQKSSTNLKHINKNTIICIALKRLNVQLYVFVWIKMQNILEYMKVFRIKSSSLESVQIAEGRKSYPLKTENVDVEKEMSIYGLKNDSDFFAESFANSQLGNPNVFGKAMEIWLQRRNL